MAVAGRTCRHANWREGHVALAFSGKWIFMAGNGSVEKEVSWMRKKEADLLLATPE
jgi:hypothetical protein